MQRRSRLAWVTVAIGMLTVISPFVLTPYLPFARYDTVVTGCIIAATAIAELLSVAIPFNYLRVVNILAGVWLFISTTWLTGNAPMAWNNIVLGVMAIVTALAGLSYAPARGQQSR